MADAVPIKADEQDVADPVVEVARNQAGATEAARAPLERLEALAAAANGAIDSVPTPSALRECVTAVNAAVAEFYAAAPFLNAVPVGFADALCFRACAKRPQAAAVLLNVLLEHSDAYAFKQFVHEVRCLSMAYRPRLVPATYIVGDAGEPAMPLDELLLFALATLAFQDCVTAWEGDPVRPNTHMRPTVRSVIGHCCAVQDSTRVVWDHAVSQAPDHVHALCRLRMLVDTNLGDDEAARATEAPEFEDFLSRSDRHSLSRDLLDNLHPLSAILTRVPNAFNVRLAKIRDALVEMPVVHLVSLLRLLLNRRHCSLTLVVGDVGTAFASARVSRRASERWLERLREEMMRRAEDRARAARDASMIKAAAAEGGADGRARAARVFDPVLFVTNVLLGRDPFMQEDVLWLMRNADVLRNYAFGSDAQLWDAGLPDPKSCIFVRKDRPIPIDVDDVDVANTSVIISTTHELAFEDPDAWTVGLFARDAVPSELVARAASSSPHRGELRRKWRRVLQEYTAFVRAHRPGVLLTQEEADCVVSLATKGEAMAAVLETRALEAR
jgi:hypothetical protein